MFGESSPVKLLGLIDDWGKPTVLIGGNWDVDILLIGELWITGFGVIPITDPTMGRVLTEKKERKTLKYIHYNL